MLRIWGRANSSNVRKVLWCAEELGLAYTRLEAGGAFGVVDTPAYRAMNPNGRIPVIEEDGFVLWESNAIVRYLVARHAGGSDWYPADPRHRAEADRWMDWATSTFAPAFRDLFWGMVRTPEAQRDLQRIEAARLLCAGHLDVADAALAQAPYLAGEAPGMGDIPLGSFIYAWFEMPIERPRQPNLEAWYARLQQRPAYRRAVMTALT
ncbi:MAG: glutathione S-transferase [Pseudoxanthomonas sp.]